ncbi:Acetyltransferase (GNAT) family protein [Micromonospora zamorensis]|nr:Acetyltransferase (GNAT) family protein [Micromonospora zamorensis]
MGGFEVRAIRPDERTAVDALHEREWGGPYVVAHDTRHDLRTLPTLVAVDDAGAVAGALTYHADEDGLEVVSLVAAVPAAGSGTALLTAATATVVAMGLTRVWLITSNDNLRALRFYQRRGMRLVGVDRGAVDRARLLKPEIPLVGDDGIPLHDELILEWRPGAGRQPTVGLPGVSPEGPPAGIGPMFDCGMLPRWVNKWFPWVVPAVHPGPAGGPARSASGPTTARPTRTPTPSGVAPTAT